MTNRTKLALGGLGVALAGAYLARRSSSPSSVFSVAELTTTSTGLPNDIDPAHWANLVALCRDVLDPLARAVAAKGWTLRLGSVYRSAAVNAKIGGSSTSQHMTGEAVDCSVWSSDGAVRMMTSHQLANFVITLGLPYDQLIYYHIERGGHIHIGYDVDDAQRRQVRYAPPEGGERFVATDPSLIDPEEGYKGV
jgi:hypothetical protein